jgi:hypothetical protein
MGHWSSKGLAAVFAMNVAAKSTPARRLRLQFSLRMLLFALTAFAIGFPIWYRWPYEGVDRETPAGSTPVVKEISTWQRQWGGGRLKHGSEKLIADGQTVLTTMYQNGKRHGPQRGQKFVGQYENDKKEGVWTDDSRWFKRISTWHRDRLEGASTIEYPDGRKLELVFANGRLTQFNRQPASNRLFDLLGDDAMDRQISEELLKYTEIECLEFPLKDVMVYLSERHNIPILVDSEHVTNIDLPITAEHRNIDLCSLLTLLTAPHGLACDYRYGCIWVTTAADAQDWHDPTCVADAKLPKGSALARAWDQPAVAEGFHLQLADVLTKTAQPLNVQIDTDRIEPGPGQPAGFPVIVNRFQSSFHNVLGYLLHQTGCRCRLEGEKLVILPPEAP